MKHLDLCSGIGGFALAARWAGFKTVQFCEIDKWCQKILKKHWPNVPCHDDLKTFDGTKYNGSIELLTAGYPCQPFSNAGRKKGENDERHLWPEVLRIIRESRPKRIICENVEGHVRLGLDTVLNDLEREGYTVWTFIIPACAVGAPHQRYRIWIVASDSNSLGCIHGEAKELTAKRRLSAFSDITTDINVTNNGSERIQRQFKKSLFRFNAFSWCKDIRSLEDLRSRRDLPKPLICRGDDGFSERMDRLKGIGNAIVPQIAYLIMETIKEYESLQPKESK